MSKTNSTFKGGGGAKFLKTKKAKLPYNTASLKSQRISHKALSAEISQSIINDDIHYFCKLIVVLLKTKIRLMRAKRARHSNNALIDEAVQKLDKLIYSKIRYLHSLGYDSLLCVERYLSLFNAINIDFSECLLKKEKDKR